MKYLLFFWITVSFLLSGCAQHNQDPEFKREFSDYKVLQTWVASKFQKDPLLMEKIQNEMGEALLKANICNSNDVMSNIENNPGDDRCFGNTVFTIEPLQLAFLKLVNTQSKNFKPVILEIAAGQGRVALSSLYAMEGEGEVYINDLSEPMLKKSKDLIQKRHLPDSLSKNIHFLPGNCLTLLDTYPNLKGKVTALYVQFLEHFFTPKEHQQFLKTISELLTPGGHAFLCANTFESPEILKWYNPHFLTQSNYQEYQKTKNLLDIYTGFLHYKITYTRSMQSPCIKEVSYNDVSRASLNDTCFIKKIKEKVANPSQKSLTKIVKREMISNKFTSQIYRDALKLHPSLELIDTYYIDNQVNQHESFEDGVIMVAAIIQKKK
jgi:ubiquinone/menaquinone biosynthesis C-methylase UbiE